MPTDVTDIERISTTHADVRLSIDWTRRAPGLTERMDGPLTYAEWHAASRDIARINRWTRAYAPTIRFLERVVAKRGVGYEPLHIVDVGCGHGDVLRRVAQWAAQRSVAVRLTGIDLNPYAARAARQCCREEHFPPGAVDWVTADIFAAQLPLEADVVISSLFTHHLLDADVARFLAWSETHARWGWIVNDLARSERAYKIFGWAARLMRVHPLVIEDGLISLQRAFVPEDWHQSLQDSRITGADVVQRATRLCVERLKG